MADSWKERLSTVAPDTHRISVLIDAANDLNRKGQTQQALGHAQVAYSLAEHLGQRRSMARALLIQGYIESVTGTPVKAVQLYRQSFVLSEAEKDHHLMVMALSYEADVFTTQGVFSRAFDLYIRALRLTQQSGRIILEAQILGSIGDIYMVQSDTAQAIAHYEKAIQLAARGMVQGEFRLINNLGNVYAQVHDHVNALKCFHHCLRIGQKHNDPHLIAFSHNNIGSVHGLMGQDGLSMDHLSRALSLRDSINDRHGMAISHSTIAEYYRHRGLLDSALHHYLQSLGIYEELENIIGQITARNGMVSIFRASGQLREAVSTTRHALQMAQETGLDNYARDLSHTLYEIYKEQGQADSALAMFELSEEYRYRMHEEETSESLVRKQFEFEMEKREALAAEQLKRQNQQRNAFIVGFVLMLGLAGVSYRSYRVKRRANIIITEQKLEVERQKAVVDQRNADIMQSFDYAQRLQKAVLPPVVALAEAFPDSFLIYLPRDVVSGDFYWMEANPPLRQVERSKIPQKAREGPGDVSGGAWLAVGDCTGHGVPGAMLSVMGLNSLSRCVIDMGLSRPKDVLQQMTLDLLVAFGGSALTVRDGMDMALCHIDRHTMTLTYAGANSAALLVRGGAVHVLRPARRPVGHHEGNAPFAQEEFKIKAGDRIYLMSDGCSDQLGGPDNKKFMTRRFREFLLSIADEPMSRQRELLLSEHNAWKGTGEQTDDMCVMGVRV